MELINTIFTVIDPTTHNQRALNRAIMGAESTGAKIHVYSCIYSSMSTDNPEELAEIEIERYKPWLNDIIKPLDEKGLEYEIEIEWNDDWHSAVGKAAARADSDLIIKNSHRRTAKKRSLLSSSEWSLFTSANCPVVLAKSERSSGTGKILLGMDLMADNEAYNQMLDAMLQYARKAEASYNEGELHVVHAFEGSENFQHVTDLARRAGVENEKVHVIGEKPQLAIQECADKIDAELIVLGQTRTTRLAGILFGSTTEWLLNHVDRDIMVVIPKKTDDSDNQGDTGE